MQITEVKVFPIHEEKLKAFVSVVFDGCFMVNDIKVIRGREGLFISMPSRKKKNGEFKDVAHPLNNETRRMIETQILGEYERVLGEKGASAVASPEQAPAFDGLETPQPVPMAAMTMASAVMAPVAMAAAEEPSAASVMAQMSPGPAVDEPQSMEEVEALHLRDSFWSVS